MRVTASNLATCRTLAIANVTTLVNETRAHISSDHITPAKHVLPTAVELGTGRAFTPEQVIQEMKKEPLTELGSSLVRTFCKSRSEIEKEIQLAKTRCSQSLPL